MRTILLNIIHIRDKLNVIRKFHLHINDTGFYIKHYYGL